MIQRISTLLFIFSLFFTPQPSFAQTENVGIINGIWFSDTPFFDGETVRIYTALQNNSGKDLQGTVEFFNNGTIIGTKSFSALDSRIIESWVDTITTAGDHIYSVRITELKNSDSSVGFELAPDSILYEKKVTVKTDTDGDGMSNDEDADDDNDGFSDNEEIKAGTNSLDNKSIPQEEEPIEENKPTKSIFVQKINEQALFLAGMIGSERDLVNEGDLLKQSPTFAQDISQESPLTKSLVIVVSKIQNTGEKIIDNETKRIDQPNTDKKEENGFMKIFNTVYVILLKIFDWLFSVWWFSLILPFFVIYLLIKILFKIFGRR